MCTWEMVQVGSKRSFVSHLTCESYNIGMYAGAAAQGAVCVRARWSRDGVDGV